MISGNEAEVDVERVDEVTEEEAWLSMPLAVMTSLTDWLFSGLVSSLKSPVRGTHLELKNTSPLPMVGSLRSYDGCCNENVALKQNFALG